MTGSYSWADVKAELDRRDRQHAARPALARKTIDAYRATRRGLRSVKGMPRNVRWFVQRGRRGWSVRDTWSLDHYLTTLISGAVLYLRDNTHGYPESMTMDEYRSMLTRIAEPLAVDVDRVIDGESSADGLAREEREHAAQQDAIRLLADNLHYLLD